MPRRKRTSRVLEKAETRAAALQAINSTLDLGNGLTVVNYLKQIQTLRDRLSIYNTALSNIDKYQNDIAEIERTLSDLSEHMLLGVATRYGKNSNEYEMAGGVRKSDRKRPVRSKAA